MPTIRQHLEERKLVQREIQGGRALVISVRAALTAQGTSLLRWCADNGVSRPWAYQALMGQRNGTQARELRARLATLAEARPIVTHVGEEGKRNGGSGSA